MEHILEVIPPTSSISTEAACNPVPGSEFQEKGEKAKPALLCPYSPEAPPFSPLPPPSPYQPPTSPVSDHSSPPNSPPQARPFPRSTSPPLPPKKRMAIAPNYNRTITLESYTINSNAFVVPGTMNVVNDGLYRSFPNHPLIRTDGNYYPGINTPARALIKGQEPGTRIPIQDIFITTAPFGNENIASNTSTLQPAKLEYRGDKLLFTLYR